VTGTLGGMGDINIGKARIRGGIVNVDRSVTVGGSLVVTAAGTPDVAAIVAAVLRSTEADDAQRLLAELDELAGRSGIPRSRVEQEASKQLAASVPPAAVVETVRAVATGAAGGVVSQGIFAVLRSALGF
jgi:hypothetical protein